jgi:hypothetical protein
MTVLSTCFFVEFDESTQRNPLQHDLFLLLPGMQIPWSDFLSEVRLLLH